MTKKFTLIFSCIVVMLAAMPYIVDAQEYVAPPVEISAEKVKRDGKLFYAHRVLERQTLYSISKAYGVTIAEIYEANPFLSSASLQKDSILLIPYREITTTVEQPAAAESVSKATEVQEQKLTKAEEKAFKAKEKEEKKREAAKYITHTVKWYEDLDVISEKYDVPVDVIMKVNNLTGRKLTKKQKLLIPRDLQAWMAENKEYVSQEGSEEEAGVNAIEEETVEQESKEEVPQDVPENVYTKKNKVNAVMLLPANAEGVKRNESSLDFYSGALLAARDLGNSGYDIELKVYDMPGKNLPVSAERLGDADVVIGPFKADALAAVLGQVDETTFIVSPLDQKADSLAWKYSNFIQVPSSVASQYEDLARWMASLNKPGDCTLIIYEKGSRETVSVKNVASLMEMYGVHCKLFSYNILEGREVQSALAERMSMEHNNRVMIMSEGEAFVNDVVRNLNLMIHNKYSVTLFCPSKIRVFETIDTDNLHATSLHLCSSYDIDYDSPQVMKFIMEYRALFNTEPGPFAFQGYDVASYFIQMCAKYGKSWPEMLSSTKADKLQSGFDFIQRNGKGWTNNAVRRIIYGENYSVERIK